MMARLLDRMEKAAAVLVLIAFCGTVLPSLLISGAIPASNAEDPGALIAFAMVYLLILGPVLLRPRGIVDALTANPAATALILLALLSTAWSIEPEVTLRRAVAFAFTTLFALHLVQRFTLREVVTLLALAVSVTTVLSLVFVLAVPAIGIDHELHPGAWKGVYFQKNVAGRTSVWLLLCLFWLERANAGARWPRRVMIALTALLLVMSDSGTGLLTAALVLAVFTAHRWLKADIRVLAAVLSFVALAGFLAVLAGTVFFEDALALIGRDPTLTGRTELWDHSLAAVAERPLLGWGYGAYWYDLNGPAAVFTAGWGVTSAHNGWIDAAIDLGLPGFALVAALAGGVLTRGFRAARYGASGAGLFALAAVAATLAVSMSESVFLERHSVTWVGFVVASAALVRSRHPAIRSFRGEGFVRHDLAA
jgi:exopolysaccharide production protein ExoQ